MNEVEKRRKILLEQTRNLYQDGKSNPAVHPRYKALYHQIYSDDMEMHKGTFGIRCIICILIFFVYISMGTKGMGILGMDHMQVQQKIMQDYMHELY